MEQVVTDAPRSESELRQLQSAISKELKEKTATKQRQPDTDIHKAENPNLYAQIQWPAMVHRCIRVAHPVDMDGQIVRDDKLEPMPLARAAALGHTETIMVSTFKQTRVENQAQMDRELKRGWYRTPLEAEQAAIAKEQAAAKVS